MIGAEKIAVSLAVVALLAVAITFSVRARRATTAPPASARTIRLEL